MSIMQQKLQGILIHDQKSITLNNEAYKHPLNFQPKSTNLYQSRVLNSMMWIYGML